MYLLLYLCTCLTLTLCFPCSVTNNEFALYCLGRKVGNIRWSEINEDLKNNITDIFITDTEIVNLEENFCAWKSLLKIHLRGNRNLNCSSLFRTVPSCVDIYGQCCYQSTRNIPKTTTLKPTHQTYRFPYKRSVAVLVTFCIIFCITSMVLAIRYKRVYRYDIYRTSV